MSPPTLHSRWRRPLLLALGLLLALSPMQTSAAGPARPGIRDITHTPEGRSFAVQASQRIEERYGIRLPAESLRVWSVGGRRMAGPRGASLAVRERRFEDGTIGRAYEASEAPTGAVGDVVALATMEEAPTGWQLVGSSCWIDDHDESSWMDVCYHKYRATSDGSTRYDYYALNMFSTFATPQFGLEVGDPWIEARPATGAPHAWHDWDPREDTTRPCTSTVSLQVVVRGIPLTVSASQCATWDITKYATAGKFRNKWTEGFCMMRQGETSLEFEIASRVAQGKVPTWTFAWYEEADLAACAF
jgi:hypothetical protein